MGPRLRNVPRLALLVVPAALAAAPLGACTSQTGDPPVNDSTPTALGSGQRIRDVMNPTALAHSGNGATVSITGATYLLVDSFDETHDGKSIGTIYMQDVPPPGSPAPPYSGAALYKPTFIPTSLVPAPGDVLDLTGTISVSTVLGSAMFTPPTSLIQIDDPILTPRFEYQLPPPVVIQASDLDEGATIDPVAYAKGQQWIGMLVTIENVTFTNTLSDSKGRDTVNFTADTTNGPTIDNELFDVASWNIAQASPPLTQGQTIKSVTGIVTWFYSYHIAPRSPADIVVSGSGSDGGQ